MRSLSKACVISLAATTSALNIGASVRGVAGRAGAPAMAGFYDFSAPLNDGSTKRMGAYKGKPTLILNVASL